MISFVIPAYNEESNIGMCIINIHEAAGQIPHEIIVVDNGSTDGTVKKVSLPMYQRWGVRVIHEPQKGVVRARQAGYKAAKYDFIANIDADNWIPKKWVIRALEELDPETVLVSGPIDYLEFGKFFYLLSQLFYWIGGLAGRYLSPMSQGGNSIMRKSALDAIGGYNTDIDFYGDDTDHAKRMSKVGKVKFSFKLITLGSGRRFLKEGVVTTTYRYVLNYLSVSFLNKPIHTTHQDIRL